MRIAILGGGPGGLAAALRLGRSGHEVDVIDRDPPPPADLGSAFSGWARRGVTQWRQYHVFRARARAELARSLPDILERLDEIGVSIEHDDEFAGLPVRRPVLEWILRREVEACPAVRVRAGTSAVGLHFDAQRRRVVGVRTAPDGNVDADIVLDAGGRRTPVAGWVAAAGYERPPETRLSCGIAYYTRYYETTSERDAPLLDRRGVELFDDGFMAHALAVGDRGTIGTIFVVPAGDPEFRALGHVEGWEAAVAAIPRLHEVLDPRVRRPLMTPAAMYGLDDVLSPWRADGVQGPHGLAHLGDSWLVTNPNLAWGSSIALAQAGALADAVDEHPRDVDSAIADYHSRTEDEVRQLFEMACDTDRALQRHWRLPSPDPTADELEREAVVFSIGRLARHGDSRAALRIERRQNLLELPNELWRDTPLLQAARDELARVPFDPNRRSQRLNRDQFVNQINRAQLALRKKSLIRAASALTTYVRAVDGSDGDVG